MRSCVPLLCLLFAMPIGAQPPVAAAQAPVVGIGEVPPGLREAWLGIGPEKRKEIERHLVADLGLSSSGKIRLVGSYGNPAGTLQFQQVDLNGSRLFWIVLVDPGKLASRVLFHVDPSKVQPDYLSFATPGE